MIKAIAIKTDKDGKVSILASGLKGDCLKVAREEGLKLKGIGEATVQVFSGAIFNDDGRKAAYQAQLQADQARAEAEAEKRAKEAKAKRIDALKAELAEAEGTTTPTPPAKKAAKKTANAVG